MSEVLVNKEIPYRDIALVSNRDKKELIVNFAVVCDAPIAEAAAYIPRTLAVVTVSARFSEDRRTFYFSSRPALPWQQCIWVQVFSRQDIRILRVTPVS